MLPKVIKLDGAHALFMYTSPSVKRISCHVLLWHSNGEHSNGERAILANLKLTIESLLTSSS